MRRWVSRKGAKLATNKSWSEPVAMVRVDTNHVQNAVFLCVSLRILRFTNCQKYIQAACK